MKKSNPNSEYFLYFVCDDVKDITHLKGKYVVESIFADTSNYFKNELNIFKLPACVVPNKKYMKKQIKFRLNDYNKISEIDSLIQTKENQFSITQIRKRNEYYTGSIVSWKPLNFDTLKKNDYFEIII